MKYTMTTAGEGILTASETAFRIEADRPLKETYASMTLTFPEWEDDAYILIPACAYNGNRFPHEYRAYPPMYKQEECGVDCDQRMSNVPALEPDGSGSIQVTTGDMATPCVGIYYRQKKEGFFLFFSQQIKDLNLGLTVSAGIVTLSYPANRTDLYRENWKNHPTSGDPGMTLDKGETVEVPHKILHGSFDTLSDFFRFFFENRKCLLSSRAVPNLYTEELWHIMEEHFDRDNWSGEFVGTADKRWGPGWCGVAMSSYILLGYGNETSKQHAESTLDYLCRYQGASGMYYGGVNEDGTIIDDSFGKFGHSHLALVRKSADILYFLFKHFSVYSGKPKEAWVESARKCADGFVKLFDRYGKFGQFVHDETGDMVVGCSTCGAIAPAGLAKAYLYFGNRRYLEVAEQTLRDYVKNFLRLGYTTGGPGEILSAPDSESAFALLESCVVLYETTLKPEYLTYAKEAAHLCSSWVVSYQFKFPDGKEFDRLGINTVGSVFANVQNKHSAPGICTLSGDVLYRLWRYTGDALYLELIRDIARFLPQCVSTEARPIYSWDKPPRKLRSGSICERVNMSDWETMDGVGGVFDASCWCETSVILTYFELMLRYKEMRED